MRMPFKLVRIGELFKMNGNTYIKKSTRTAAMIGMGPVGTWCKTFYIEQLAPCKVD